MSNIKTTRTKNLTESRGKKNKMFLAKARKLGLTIDPKYITLVVVPKTNKLSVVVRVPNGKKKYFNANITMRMVQDNEVHLLLVAEQLRDYILNTGKNPTKEVRSKLIKAVQSIATSEQESGIAQPKQRRKYKQRKAVKPIEKIPEEIEAPENELVIPEQESKSNSTPKLSVWSRILNYIGW